MMFPSFESPLDDPNEDSRKIERADSDGVDDSCVLPDRELYPLNDAPFELASIKSFLLSKGGTSEQNLTNADVIVSAVTAMSKAQQRDFFEHTLPAVRRLILSTAEPGVVVSKLCRAVEDGAFAVCLPLFLRESPEQPLSHLLDSLHFIARGVGEKQSSDVFEKVIPALSRRYGKDFHTNGLNEFRQLAEEAGEKTALLCLQMLPRLGCPLVEEEHPTDELSESDSPRNLYSQWSSVQCIGLLCSTMKSYPVNPTEFAQFFTDVVAASRYGEQDGDPPPYSNATNLFFHLNLMRGSWGHNIATVEVAFIGMVRSMTAPLTLRQLNRLCTVCRGEGDSVLTRIEAIREVVPTADNEAVIDALAQCGKLTAAFGNHHSKRLAEYYAAAASCDRVELFGEIASKLSDAIGHDQVGYNLAYLQAELSSLSDEDALALLRECLESGVKRQLRQLSHGILCEREVDASSPLHKLLLYAIVSGGPYNRWRLGREAFNERYAFYQGFHADPAIVLPEQCGFKVPLSPERSELVYTGSAPVSKWLQVVDGIRDCFEPTDFTLKARALLETIAELQGKAAALRTSVVTPKNVLARYLEVARDIQSLKIPPGKHPSQVFANITQRCLPFLAPATATMLPFVKGPSHEQKFSTLYEYLEVARLLLDDYMPERFRDSGVPENIIKQFKDHSPLKKIQWALNGLHRPATSEVHTVLLIAEKALYDSFYDQTAQSCPLFRLGQNDIHQPYFQPIRMVVPSRVRNFGSWYMLKGSVGGIPSFILAGGGPTREAVKETDVKLFVKNFLECLKSAMPLNGVRAIFQAVGPPELPAAPRWKHEGRIAQYEQVIRAVESLALPRAYAIQLAPEEVIAFPSGHKPIEYVFPLWIS